MDTALVPGAARTVSVIWRPSPVRESAVTVTTGGVTEIRGAGAAMTGKRPPSERASQRGGVPGWAGPSGATGFAAAPIAVAFQLPGAAYGTAVASQPSSLSAFWA